MADYLNSEQIMLKAYLGASTAQVVYEWLSSNAPERVGESAFLPEETQFALHSRRDPLIDLGLALFSTSRELLSTLYRDGALEIRCAVLSNQLLGKVFGIVPIFSGEESGREFFQGPSVLHEALFTNPSIAYNALVRLFERTDGYADISDEVWKFMLIAAGQNPRLRVELRNKLKFSWDEGDDYASAQIAAWGLLERLPVTEEWATDLHSILYDIPYHLAPGRDVSAEARNAGDELEATEKERFILKAFAVSGEVGWHDIEFFSAVLERWSPADETPSLLEKEGDPYVSGLVNPFARLRNLVAFRGAKNMNLGELLRDHPDRNVRYGYYRGFTPRSAPEVENAFQRDGAHFVGVSIENEWFYRTEAGEARQEFSRIVHDEQWMPDTKTWSGPERYDYLALEFSRSSAETYGNVSDPA